MSCHAMYCSVMYCNLKCSKVMQCSAVYCMHIVHNPTTERRRCSSFLGSIVESPIRKTGHTQEGATLEPQGIELTSGSAAAVGPRRLLAADTRGRSELFLMVP